MTNFTKPGDRLMRSVFLISLLLITSLFSQACSADKFKNSILSKDYDQLYIKLEQKVKIPIFIPMKKTLYDELGDIYLNQGNISKDAYQFYFDMTRDCLGSNPCSGGSFFASKIMQKMPTNDAVAFPTVSNKTHDKIKLANNITAYIEKEHMTGAGSSAYRTLTWEIDGARYQLTLKALPDKVFIKMANSAITGNG